jgi:hypothetical protein
MMSLPHVRVACFPFALALLVALGYCRIASANDDAIVVLRELRYRDGRGKSWTLDLAMPKADGEKARPAVVVIHGGGWIEGDKSSFSTADAARPANILGFAKLGFRARRRFRRHSTIADARFAGYAHMRRSIASIPSALRLTAIRPAGIWRCCSE